MIYIPIKPSDIPIDLFLAHLFEGKDYYWMAVTWLEQQDVPRETRTSAMVRLADHIEVALEGLTTVFQLPSHALTFIAGLSLNEFLTIKRALRIKQYASLDQFCDLLFETRLNSVQKVLYKLRPKHFKRDHYSELASIAYSVASFENAFKQLFDSSQQGNVDFEDVQEYALVVMLTQGDITKEAEVLKLSTGNVYNNLLVTHKHNLQAKINANANR
jgi:hypothetical protein